MCIWETSFTPYLSWKAELPCLSYKYLLRTCWTLLRLICLCTSTHALNCVKLNRETKLNNVVTIRWGGPFVWRSRDQSKIKLKHASKWTGYVELFPSVNECDNILMFHPGCIPFLTPSVPRALDKAGTVKMNKGSMVVQWSASRVCLQCTEVRGFAHMSSTHPPPYSVLSYHILPFATSLRRKRWSCHS